MLNVYILTHRRPKTGFEYLRSLLQEIDRQGASSATKVVVNGSPNDLQEVRRLLPAARVPPIVRLVARRSPLDNTGDLIRTLTPGSGAYGCLDMLRYAAQDRMHTLLLEDDVILSSSALQKVKDVKFPPGVGIITFCDMAEVAEGAPPGMYVRDAKGACGLGFWGNQMLYVHRFVLPFLSDAEVWTSEEVWNSYAMVAHLEHAGTRDNANDIFMSQCLRLHNRRPYYAVHVPSLAIHVGEDSLCAPGLPLEGSEKSASKRTRNLLHSLQQYYPKCGQSSPGPGY